MLKYSWSYMQTRSNEKVKCIINSFCFVLHDILFEYTQQHRSKLLNAHKYIKMHTVNISA